MESVETIINMSGEQRKELVTQVIQKIVSEETSLEPSIQNLLVNMAEEMIPNVIDIIINTSKGNYSINTKKKCKALIPGCLRASVKTIKN